MELKSYILNFTKNLKEIGQNNLDNYQRNIKTLKIEISDFTNRKTNNAATYNERENKIYLRDLFIDDSFYHELLHVASTKVDEDNIYSGISLNDYNVGLNEGFTQLLTEEYFSINKEDTLTYPYETLVAKIIYLIMGKDMLNSYLQADINGFLNNLSNYLSKEDIQLLINNLDFIHRNLYQEEKEEKKKMHNITLILSKASKSVIELSDFIDILDYTININGNEYDFLANIEEVKNEYRKNNSR